MLPLSALFFLIAAAAWGAPAEETRTLVRAAFDHLQASESRRIELPFTRYVERKELAPDGTVKQQRSSVFRNKPEERKDHEDARLTSRNAWLREFPDAVDCRADGEETIDARPAFVFDCTPHPGYRPKNAIARVFGNMHCRLWIDRQDAQLIKGDGELLETVTIGWGVLGKIEKGSEFHIQRRKVTPELWLTVDEAVRFYARLIFKPLRMESDTRYEYGV